MEYDLIILGATFLSLGAAKAFNGKCLIIDEKTKPGYEFIDAFKNGNNYSRKYLRSEEIKSFFEEKALLENVFIPGWTTHICKWIGENNLSFLLMTNVISVEKEEGRFKLLIHNVNGRSVIYTKKLLDTRIKKADRKFLNAVVSNKEGIDYNLCENLVKINETTAIFEFEVPSCTSYIEARQSLYEAFKNRKDKKLKIAAIADCFYETENDFERKIDENYLHCSSSSFENPFAAFDYGFKIGEEMKK